jgi:hypothetical protein
LFGESEEIKQEAKGRLSLLAVRRSRSISLTLMMEAVRSSTNIGDFYRTAWFTSLKVTLVIFSTAKASDPTRAIIFSTVPEVNTEEA